MKRTILWNSTELIHALHRMAFGCCKKEMWINRVTMKTGKRTKKESKSWSILTILSNVYTYNFKTHGVEKI